MLRTLFAALLFIVAGLAAEPALARCTGTDLSEHLTPSAQARLEKDMARTPFAYGNHWVATRGDRKLHVIGTMHDGDSRMTPIMRRLRPVIRDADAVLLEVTSTAADDYFRKLWQNPSVFFLQSPPYLNDLLGEEEWQLLSTIMNSQGFPPEVAARMQPWFAGFFLGETRCGSWGLGSFKGLDDRIEATARNARVAIGSLETTGTGFQALTRQPLRDQVRMLELDLKTQMNLDDFDVTLTEAYFQERLAEGIRIQDWLLYSDLDVSRSEVDRLNTQFNRLLLDDRNRAWIKVIERTDGPVLVIAVGAAHLPGKTGILNLLKGKGYSLERAEF